MASRHSTITRKPFALRIAGGALVAASAVGCVGVAYAADTSHSPASMGTSAAALGHAASAPKSASQGYITAAGINSMSSGTQRNAAANIAKTKDVTAQDFVNQARKQVGIHANSSNGGTKFQKWFMTTARAQTTVKRDGGSIKDYADASWCDMFVSWVGNSLGISGTVGIDPYTVTHAKWFQAHDHWGTKAKVGAIVFFDWNGGKSVTGIDHVGLVTKAYSDGSIDTVEGNSDHKVTTHHRTADTIVGYGYPQYAGK